MSPTAALELVACVLNGSNWQTLLGMAEKGQSPQYPAGKPKREKRGLEDLSSAEVSYALDVAREGRLGERLAAYYAEDGQHPVYTHAEWNDEWTDQNTVLQYWPWVAHQIDNNGMMLPWDKEANEDVQLAIAAGVVAQFDDPVWFAAQGGPVDPEETFDSEDEFWDYAANEVSNGMRLKMSPGAWSDLSFAKKIVAVKEELTDRALNNQEVEFQPVPNSDGPFDVMLDGRQYGLHEDFDSACTMAEVVARGARAMGHLVEIRTRSKKYAAGFMDKKTPYKVFLATLEKGDVEVVNIPGPLQDYLEMNWDEEESFQTRSAMIGSLKEQATLAVTQKGRAVVVGYQEFELTKDGRVVHQAPQMKVAFYVAGGGLTLAASAESDLSNALQGCVF